MKTLLPHSEDMVSTSSDQQTQKKPIIDHSKHQPNQSGIIKRPLMPKTQDNFKNLYKNIEENSTMILKQKQAFL